MLDESMNELSFSTIVVISTITRKVLYDDVIIKSIEISDELFSKLHSGDLMFLKDSDVYREIEGLVVNGFFRIRKRGNSKHTLNDVIWDIQRRKLSKLVLQVTKQCNLKCLYCPFSQNGDKERTHCDKYMEIDTGVKSVDFLYEHASDSNNITIEFYGGEPLLNQNFIVCIIEYTLVKFRDRLIKFNIVTNCTLLNEEFLKYLISKEVTLFVSLDGNKETNDANRVFRNNSNSVYENILDNLRMIYKIDTEYFKNNVRISTVIDPKNSISDYLKLIEEEEFIGETLVRANLKNDEFLTEKNNISNKYISEKEYYKFLALLGEIMGWRFKECGIVINEMNKAEELLYASNNGYIDKQGSLPGGQCIPGHAKLFITTEGKFMTCEKMSELCEANYIGDIDLGFDKNKVLSVANCFERYLDKCDKCYAYNNCALCFATLAENVKADTERELDCESMRRSFKERLQFKLQMEEIVDVRGVRKDD